MTETKGKVSNATIDLSVYGIHDVKEVIHNPSYELLFEEETKRGFRRLREGYLN